MLARQRPKAGAGPAREDYRVNEHNSIMKISLVNVFRHATAMQSTLRTGSRFPKYHRVFPNRLLKKSIHGLFQHATQKARFLRCFIFQTLSVFEKWRCVPIPRPAGSPSAAVAVPFGILPLRTLAHPCASQEARERPPQGDEKRVFHHPADNQQKLIGLLTLIYRERGCVPALCAPLVISTLTLEY